MPSATPATLPADNPFALPSRLPYGTPAFDTIRDAHYLPAFTEARQTRFFLCVRSTGTRFDPEAAARMLADFRPLAVWEVPAE